MCENCTPTGRLCPNCGADPCYHMCHNSQHFYSPEQERYDAMMDDGSDDIRERFAAEAEDMRLEGEREAAYWAEQDRIHEDAEGWHHIVPAPPIPPVINDDDIPF